MRTWRDELILWACVAAVVAALFQLPAAWQDRVVTGLAVVATGLVAALVLYLLVQTSVQARRIKQIDALPPPPPTACPACGGTYHEYMVGGLWHGAPDPVTGYRTGGSFG